MMVLAPQTTNPRAVAAARGFSSQPAKQVLLMTAHSVTQSTHQEIAGVIEIRHNKPMVSSLKIAELFERRHDSVLRAIRKELADEISLRKVAESETKNSRGKPIPIFWLDERQALIVMPFLGGQKSREGQRKLVDAYLYYRDAFANPPRTEIIRAKRDASRLLTDSILDWRAFEGKDTDQRHYMSEQKLCNWAITGQFAKLDESALSNENIDLLREIRETNAALIVTGMAYNDRKTALAHLVMRRRTKQLQERAA